MPLGRLLQRGYCSDGAGERGRKVPECSARGIPWCPPSRAQRATVANGMQAIPAAPLTLQICRVRDGQLGPCNGYFVQPGGVAGRAVLLLHAPSGFIGLRALRRLLVYLIVWVECAGMHRLDPFLLNELA